MITQEKPKVALVFAGHDPCGGAGIQADIETMSHFGVQTSTVLTALTVQDSVKVHRVQSVDSTFMTDQARAILEDMPVDVIKLGMLSSIRNIEDIHHILKDYRDIPVVVDPIIRAGDGSVLSNEEMTLAYSDLLFPLTTLVTPNSIEALKLAPEADSLFAAAQELMDDGCQYVLITGTHEATTDVCHTLYTNYQQLKHFSYPRLPHEYHGSGCTLASAASALMANGLAVSEAVEQALAYTWQRLKQGHQLGMGQFHPFRLNYHAKPS